VIEVGDEGSFYLGNLDQVAKRAAEYIKSNRVANKMITWGYSYSLWPAYLVTACCGTEMAAASGPRFDLERLGFLSYGNPRQSNLVVIDGTLSIKMAKVVRTVWEQMPEPKWVIAMGACVLDGGIFWNSYNTVLARDVLPVDVYVPGCPPRPEALATSVIMLKEKIKEQQAKYLRRSRKGALNKEGVSSE
jgi:NADH-quinone oxidoreductase subunit B